MHWTNRERCAGYFGYVENTGCMLSGKMQFCRISATIKHLDQFVNICASKCLPPWRLIVDHIASENTILARIALSIGKSTKLASLPNLVEVERGVYCQASRRVWNPYYWNQHYGSAICCLRVYWLDQLFGQHRLNNGVCPTNMHSE